MNRETGTGEITTGKATLDAGRFLQKPSATVFGTVGWGFKSLRA
jgi:hypothetical protein